MNINGFKNLSHWAACLLLLFLAGNASAANCWDPVGTQTINFGTITVTTSLPVGARIAAALSPQMPGNSTRTILVPGYSDYMCPFGHSGNLGIFSSPYDASQKIYNTNIPGVGIRIFRTSPSSGLTDPQLSVAIPFSNLIFANPTSNGSPVMNPENYLVELIKTANTIGSGTLSSGIVATRTDSSGTLFSSLQIAGTIANPVATCSLSTNNATFNMGTQPTTYFDGGAGHTYAWVTNQSLISGGCVNATTVSMTFSGTAAPAPYQNAFANRGGTATGIAMELWKANSTSQAIPNSTTPITFTPEGAGGQYTFSARYIQVAPTVTSGSVNAQVIVNVNYQ